MEELSAPFEKRLVADHRDLATAVSSPPCKNQNSPSWRHAKEWNALTG